MLGYNLRRIVSWSEHSKSKNFYHSHLKGIFTSNVLPEPLFSVWVGQVLPWNTVHLGGKKRLMCGWARDHLWRLYQTWQKVKSKSVLRLLQNKLLAINHGSLPLCQGICWCNESEPLRLWLEPCLCPSHFSWLHFLLLSPKPSGSATPVRDDGNLHLCPSSSVWEMMSCFTFATVFISDHFRCF